MAWEKISFRLNFYKTFRKHKVYFLTAAIFLFAISFIAANAEQALKISYQNYAEKYISLLNSHIESDINMLRKDAREISEMPDVRQYIKKNDTAKLAELLNREKHKRGLQMMLAVNEDGVAVYRGLLSLHKGDYVFQTNDWGHQLAMGNRVNTVVKGPNLPLFMTAAEPMIENDKVFGSISASTQLDDEYANDLKKYFFQDDTEVVFWSRENGLISSSFELDDHEIKENEVREFITTFFNTPSGTLVDHKLSPFINIDGDNYYLARYDFPGIESSPGSAFLLIPHKDGALILLFSLVFSFLFLTVSVLYFNKKCQFWRRKKKRNKKQCLSILLFTIVVFLLSYMMLAQVFHKKFVTVNRPLYTIYNSVLKVEPSSQTLDSNFQNIISIVIEPGGEEINAIGINLKYDPDIVRVVDILKEDSICRSDMFLEKSIDNENGEVNISCVMPNYQANIKKGVVAKLVVQGKKAGSFMLDFASDSQVLANDGLGTNVLRAAIGGFYQVENFLSNATGIDRLMVFSPTHPNSNKWYNEPKVIFSLIKSDGAEYLYILDQNPDTIPDLSDNISKQASLEFDIEKDGIYYLHTRPIKDKNMGPANHFRIMIDTTPPRFIEKKVSHTNIEVNDVVRMVFSAQDDTSGIQSYYTKIENDLFLPVASPIYMPFTKSGMRAVTIRAFDNANNFRDEVVYIKVKGDSWLENIINISLSDLFN